MSFPSEKLIRQVQFKSIKDDIPFLFAVRRFGKTFFITFFKQIRTVQYNGMGNWQVCRLVSVQQDSILSNTILVSQRKLVQQQYDTSSWSRLNYVPRVFFVTNLSNSLGLF